jgi:hypothetical protein
MNNAPTIPENLLHRNYGEGHLFQTDYGWRYFPGSSNIRKDLKTLREFGWKITRMNCGTYRVTLN